MRTTNNNISVLLPLCFDAKSVHHWPILLIGCYHKNQFFSHLANYLHRNNNFFYTPSTHPTMAREKLKLGDSVECSVLLHYLCPSRDTKEVNPNCLWTNCLDDLVAVGCKTTTGCECTIESFCFCHENFDGLVHCVQQFMKVLK